ncbi:MAG: hypothetical protein IT380_04410 [Myxococcales bacterium]|nr:hypothetical protein [Myxococcales bacterium]
MRVRALAVLALVSLSACGPSGPAQMEFVEVLPPQPRIGDVVTVRFKLLDYRGVPLAGSNVDFKLESDKAGVTLNPRSASSLKGSGFAETQVVATTRVNSVIVVATSGDKTVKSPPITFAGTVPNGRQFTFQCGEIAGPGSGGRHAIGAYDQSRSLIAGIKISCSAHAGDRNGDGVAGALISFMTEAGAVGPTETSTADNVGSAAILHKTSLPLPMDVPPDQFSWAPLYDSTHTGTYLAPLWMEPYDWVENPLMRPPGAPTLREPRRPDPIRRMPDGTFYENNPRDNLVTMIAVTSGEEGFTDSNNNGRYDQGEDIDDLTEPFVDSNDNGTWDPEERFIDIDGDLIWDGKNDRWDANTLIWVEEKLLWTGIPNDEDITPTPQPPVPGHRPVFLPITGRMDLRCPGSGTLCAQAGDPLNGYGPFDVVGYVADPWFNSLAQNGDGDKCAILEEDESPVKVRGGQANAGIVFTYPAGRYLSFSIGDARDPNVPLEQNVPRRNPAIGFKSAISCRFTASPLDSYQILINVGSVTGTIE